MFNRLISSAALLNDSNRALMSRPRLIIIFSVEMISKADIVIAARELYSDSAYASR